MGGVVRPARRPRPRRSPGGPCFPSRRQQPRTDDARHRVTGRLQRTRRRSTVDTPRARYEAQRDFERHPNTLRCRQTARPDRARPARGSHPPAHDRSRRRAPPSSRARDWRHAGGGSSAATRVERTLPPMVQTADSTDRRVVEACARPAADTARFTTPGSKTRDGSGSSRRIRLSRLSAMTMPSSMGTARPTGWSRCRAAMNGTRAAWHRRTFDDLVGGDGTTRARGRALERGEASDS